MFVKAPKALVRDDSWLNPKNQASSEQSICPLLPVICYGIATILLTNGLQSSFVLYASTLSAGT